jgi:hypothetical protein
MSKRLSLQQKRDVYFALTLAQEHLAQYRNYSEAMREIGRGMHLSSEFLESSAAIIVENAIRTMAEQVR